MPHHRAGAGLYGTRRLRRNAENSPLAEWLWTFMKQKGSRPGYNGVGPQIKRQLRHIPPNNPPNIPPKMAPIMAKTMTAGMDAMTHLTMNTTMDMNGIWMSTIVT
jgi:hypothetical protein